MSEKVTQVLDLIKGLSLIEVSELVKAMEEDVYKRQSASFCRE